MLQETGFVDFRRFTPQSGCERSFWDLGIAGRLILETQETQL